MMADLRTRSQGLAEDLLYGDVPELRMTKKFERMSLAEIHAANIAIRQFRDLLMTLLKDTASRNTVFHAYNRFTDVTYSRAMDLAIAEDARTSQSDTAQRRYLRRFASFLLSGGRR